MSLLTRKVSIEQGAKGPKTWNAENRSVSAVIATEAPVMRSDYIRGTYSEILLNSGMKMAGDRVPLQDSHNRIDTKDTIGSVRDISVEKKGISGKVFFSSVPEAEGPAKKVEEGHLDSFSVGYVIEKAKFIEEGKKEEIRGKTYHGPSLVATRWLLKEVSLVAIPADPNAKARAENIETITKKEKLMEENKALEAAQAEAEQLRKEIEALKGRKPEEKVINLADEQKKRAEAEAKQAEIKRGIEIRGISRECNLGDDFETDMIRSGHDLNDVRKFALEKIRKMSGTDGGIGHRGPITIPDGRDERDKFRAAGTDAILLKIGGAPEKVAPGADDLRGYSLKELARESLRIAGQPIHGTAHQMVGRAFGNSDFPLLIDSVLNNSLQRGFDTAMEQWNICFDTGTVSDFREHHESRASETNDLKQMATGEEYSYGKMTEHRETYKIAKYGGMDAVYRETIIDDNLRALSNIPMKHGEAAARKIGDVAWAAMTSNPNMGDGTALFHADHGNLATAAGPIGVATLNAANKAMRLQKDLRSLRRLNIVPVFVVAPVNLQGDSEIFFGSSNFSDSDTIATDSSLASTRRNIWGGSRLIQIYEPRLDDSSTTAWYLLGARGTTVTVFFLEGEERPFMASREGWSVDGIEYKVRIQAGAKALAWESMYKNAGA